MFTFGAELFKWRHFILFYLRKKSWKSECVLSFNMDWRILAFFPEPELSFFVLVFNLFFPGLLFIVQDIPYLQE